MVTTVPEHVVLVFGLSTITEALYSAHLEVGRATISLSYSETPMVLLLTVIIKNMVCPTA